MVAIDGVGATAVADSSCLWENVKEHVVGAVRQPTRMPHALDTSGYCVADVV